MAEFEELRLTVNLVDNATAGLARIRTEIGQLTQSAGQMVTSFNQAATGLTNVSTAATRAAPALRTAAVEMRQLEQHARTVGGGLRDMGMAVTLSSGGLTQLGVGLASAVGGLRQAATAAGTLGGANIRMATLALGGLAVGFTAVGAAAALAGVYIFKFARETDQLSRTARGLGITFTELRSAGEEARRFGGSIDEVVQSAAGMQKAVTDLQRNGSQLRADLVGQGLDPAWLQAFTREEEHWKRSNLARREALLIEENLIRQGRTRVAARGEVNELLAKLGLSGAILDRPAMGPPDPRWKMIEDKSRIVMDIWREIDKKIMGINFPAMAVGLDVLTSVLGAVDKTLGAILNSVDLINKGFVLIGTTLGTVVLASLRAIVDTIPLLKPLLFGIEMLGKLKGLTVGEANPVRDAPHQKLTGGFGSDTLAGGAGNDLLGANDNIRSVSNVDDRLQSIIKGGVFDALVEYAAFAQVGNKAGFQTVGFGGSAGAAAGGGFQSGGGFSVIPGGAGGAGGGGGGGGGPTFRRGVGPGAGGGGAGGADTGDTSKVGNEFLASQRARLKKELDDDPELKKRAAAIIQTENPGAGTAVMESAMNRAIMTGRSLRSILSGGPRSFYGPARRGQIEPTMANMSAKTLAERYKQIDAAAAGSNQTLGATDQGSAGDPNYVTGGTGVNINRERFNDWGGFKGVENSRRWREQQQTQVRRSSEEAAAAAAAKSSADAAKPQSLGPMSDRYSSQRMGVGKGLSRIEVTGGQTDNWDAIDKAAEVRATGKLSVDVNAPPGTKVDASGGGLFKDTELQRSTQMPLTQSGAPAFEERFRGDR